MSFLHRLPRQLASTLTSALLVSGISATAFAQTFPTKPVRIVIGFPAGGAIDLVGRIIAPKLSDALGQPVVVDNRPGANGALGLDAVAKAAPDGHTMFLGTLGNLSINPSLYPNPQLNIDKQFTPLMLLTSVSFVLYANPSLPVNSVAELVTYGKANPDKLNYSSSGKGGLPHLAGELFSSAVGVKMTHVAYKGSAPSINDVMGGQVQFTFESAAIGLQHLKTGRLRALATTGLKRSAFLPNVPTVAETLPGFEVVNWFGLVLPAGTPREVITRLNTEITKVLALPEVREKLIAQGTDPVGGTPEAFGAFIQSETSKWARIIRQGNITPD
jgi:tripartite-type tricarboxylate transporter receptor subunit TctC